MFHSDIRGRKKNTKKNLYIIQKFLYKANIDFILRCINIGIPTAHIGSVLFDVAYGRSQIKKPQIKKNNNLKAKFEKQSLIT